MCRVAPTCPRTIRSPGHLPIFNVLTIFAAETLNGFALDPLIQAVFDASLL
jgi:hypothetical protein